jgi:hypothetical protein
MMVQADACRERNSVPSLDYDNVMQADSSYDQVRVLIQIGQERCFAGSGSPFGNFAKSLAAEGTVAETRMTTVLGSGRDVAPYANRPGFNVLNMDNLPASEWSRQNALWLNQAVTRGDQIWLVTDPAAHAQLMQQLGKSSYYIDLELPMLNQYSGVNAIPKFAAPHP